MNKKYTWSREWLHNEHVKEGKSVNQIARAQGVGWHTIQRHLVKNGIPIQKHSTSDKQYPNLKPSPELSYILGVIAGDGCVSSCGHIVLVTKDYAFAEEFEKALKAIGLRAKVTEENYWHKYMKQYFHSWVSYANSVVFARWYGSLTQDQIEKIASLFPWEYLKGFFESEGSYTITPNGSASIRFSNSAYDLLLMVQRLLTLLGHNSNIYERKFKTQFTDHEVTEYSLNLLGSSEKKHEFIKKLNPVIKNQPYDYSDLNGLRGHKTWKGEPGE